MKEFTFDTISFCDAGEYKRAFEETKKQIREYYAKINIIDVALQAPILEIFKTIQKYNSDRPRAEKLVMSWYDDYYETDYEDTHNFLGTWHITDNIYRGVESADDSVEPQEVRGWRIESVSSKYVHLSRMHELHMGGSDPIYTMIPIYLLFNDDALEMYINKVQARSKRIIEKKNLKSKKKNLNAAIEALATLHNSTDENYGNIIEDLQQRLRELPEQ